MSSVVQTVAPTETPVNLDDLKLRLRITDNDFDSALMDILNGAVDYCQEYQWAQYVTATFVERFDCFPCEIRPKKCPLLSVTSLTYVDTAGATQTLTQNTDYTVDIYSKPGRIIPAFNKSWPATRGFINDVVLTYTAGYGAATDVPDDAKQAVTLKAMQAYQSCDDQGAMDRVIHSILDKRSFRVFY